MLTPSESVCIFGQSDNFNTENTLSTEYSDMSVTSASSTPSKRGAAGVTKATLANLKPHLREDLADKLCYGAPIEAFVQHVWGVSTDHIKRILDQEWPLEGEPLKSYEAAKAEPDMYAPFAALADQLVDDVRALLVPDAPKVIKFWSARGYQTIVNKFATRKPDMLTMHESFRKPVWLVARQIIEFKRNEVYTKRERRGSASSNSVLPILTEDSVSDGSSYIQSGELSSVRPGRKSAPRTKPRGGRHGGLASIARRHGSRRASNASRPSTPAESSSVMSSHGASQKRKIVGDGGSDEAPAKRARESEPDSIASVKLTVDQLQLATYALESMAVSTRHYTSGIFIDGFKVSLWYFDRACIIRTDPFIFNMEPGKLALALYALSMCDDKHSGFDPLMVIPSADIRATDPSGPSVSPAIALTGKDCTPQSSVVGAIMVFPPAPSLHKPVKYVIKSILFNYRGLVGRGTMVYEVSLVDGSSNNTQALKVSWPLTVRPLETSTIQKVLSAIPGWRDHLPEVHFSSTLTAEELELPRVELLRLCSVPRFEDRHMHALVMSKYRKIWEVDSIDEFQDAFVDCLECHYHAFTTGRVLHRDLSENNLMFKREGGVVKGVLNDWDMASHLTDEGQAPLSTATHRTGTVPFMARDLLVDRPPAHLYRHDLESFFYILVWAAVHYRFDQNAKLPLNPTLDGWDSTLEISHDAKNSFITSNRRKNEVFNLIGADVRPLWLKWLTPLWTLFSDASIQSLIFERDDTPNPAYDHTTYGGYLTFQAFMKAIGREPQGLFPKGASN